MDPKAVPDALRQQLGAEATMGLLALLEVARRQWSSEGVSVTTERFERRLVEETSSLRIDMSEGFAQLRQEMSEGSALLRKEMVDGAAALRKEMVDGAAALRKEMMDGAAVLRQEMAEGAALLRKEMVESAALLRKEIAELAVQLRAEMADGDAKLRHELASLREDIAARHVELLKWSFMFWVGQVVTLAALMSVMFRASRP